MALSFLLLSISGCFAPPQIEAGPERIRCPEVPSTECPPEERGVFRYENGDINGFHMARSAMFDLHLPYREITLRNITFAGDQFLAIGDDACLPGCLITLEDLDLRPHETASDKLIMVKIHPNAPDVRLVVRNVTVHGVGWGFDITSTGTASFEDVRVRASDQGIYLRDLERAELAGLDVRGAERGLVLQNMGPAELRDSHFESNQVGVDVFLGPGGEEGSTVENVTFRENGRGLQNAFRTLNIRGSTFERNGNDDPTGCALEAGGFSTVVAQYNRFLDNRHYGFCGTSMELSDVRNNWWGSPDGPSLWPWTGTAVTVRTAGDLATSDSLYHPWLTHDPAAS